MSKVITAESGDTGDTIGEQRRKQYTAGLREYGQNHKVVSDRGIFYIQNNLHKWTAAINDVARKLGVPDNRRNKDDFAKMLDKSYHSKDEIDKIVNCLFTNSDGPAWLKTMKWIIIEGGDRNSRSLAMNSILYRIIMCNVNDLSTWHSVNRTYTSTLLRLAEQYRYRDNNEDSLVAKMKNADLLCIEDIGSSELLTPIVRTIVDDIFTCRERDNDNKITMITVDNRADIKSHGTCLGMVLSIDKIPNNPTNTIAIIRIA